MKLTKSLSAWHWKFLAATLAVVVVAVGLAVTRSQWLPLVQGWSTASGGEADDHAGHNHLEFRTC